MEEIKEMNPFDVEIVEKGTKRHPTIFETFAFSRALSQIKKGNEGKITVNGLGEMPSTLLIDKSVKSLSEKWEREMKKEKSSLLLAVVKNEWKSLLCAFLAINLSQLLTLVFPLMILFMVEWIKEENPKEYIGFLYAIVIIITQLIDSSGYQFTAKWVFN